MKLPYWLLRLLPMWDYICPKCKKQVSKNSHECPYCGERFPFPLRVPPKVLKDPEALEEYVHQHVFPKVSAWQREYLTRYFTIIFQDGFESGDFSAWTGTTVDSENTLEVISSAAHHGSYGARSKASAFAGNAFCYKTLDSVQTELHARMYVKVLSWGSMTGYGGPLLLITTTGGVRLAFCGIYNDGGTYKWALRTYGDSSWTLTDVTLQTNIWVCLELRVLKSTSGEAKLYIDDVLKATVSKDTSGWQPQVVRCGQDWFQGGDNTITEIYLDCVVIADSYIGPEGQTYEISVDAVCQATATPTFQTTYNIAKDAAVASQSLITTETTYNILLDAIVNALADVLVEKIAGAVYEIYVDAVTQCSATVSTETIYQIFKDALAQATVTVEEQVTFNISLDAIVKALAESQLQSEMNIYVDAIVKALDDVTVMVALPHTPFYLPVKIKVKRA
ncbi:MAG: hypothetical protein QXK47_02375 [Candidatus Bathyarchaeia archaeon]